ncbi:MAG: hypothetical protein IJM44_03125, partial [Ruminococcus sp.]|nr:hypothetical protein [Ruminococcus sp.]
MKNYRKAIASITAVVLSAGATGSIAYAKTADKEPAELPAEAGTPAPAASRTAEEGAAFKDETVYVLCNNDSTVKNIIVSDWLKNTGALTSLSDVSSLSDIENVKGYESFAQSGSTLDWAANGSDIYYKGTSTKELPVGVTVTYFLDGKEISPAELKGKSGKVTIRWTYENRQRVTKKVNGEDTDICVPFMAASAAVLSTDNFTNVSVTNGKVISDGEKLIVVGIAFPGLNDSLALGDIEGLDVSLPDTFEITADVTDFEMN